MRVLTIQVHKSSQQDVCYWCWCCVCCKAPVRVRVIDGDGVQVVVCGVQCEL